MQAGKLNQRVLIEQRTAGVDALGQELTSWTTVADTWAAAKPLRGREFFAAGQMQSEVSIKFSIRWRAGIEPTMRLTWRGQPHEIISVIDVEGARQVLELMCLDGVRDGH